MSTDPQGSAACDQRFVDDLLESRNWWQDEALRIEHDYERLAFVVGVIGVVGAFIAFWLGVLVG